jgi:hypothetical protein
MTWLPGRVLLADEETVEAIACAIDPRYRALVLLLRYGRRHPRPGPGRPPHPGVDSHPWVLGAAPRHAVALGGHEALDQCLAGRDAAHRGV